MIKLKLNITGSNPPFEYRLVGTEDWQDEPVFEVPALDGEGGYSVEVRDSTGCSKTFEIYEEEIGLELIGGYVTPQLGVYASYGSNVPVQAQIDWGIGDGYPYDPANFMGTTEWTKEFSVINIIPFPISFTGSLHFFRAWGRSRLGQTYQNSIRGIYFVPGVLEIGSPMEVEANALFPEIEEVSQEVSLIARPKSHYNPQQQFMSVFSSSSIQEESINREINMEGHLKTRIQTTIT